jgi:hypothetical protein
MAPIITICPSWRRSHAAWRRLSPDAPLSSPDAPLSEAPVEDGPGPGPCFDVRVAGRWRSKDEGLAQPAPSSAAPLGGTPGAAAQTDEGSFSGSRSAFGQSDVRPRHRSPSDGSGPPVVARVGSRISPGRIVERDSRLQRYETTLPSRSDEPPTVEAHSNARRPVETACVGARRMVHGHGCESDLRAQTCLGLRLRPGLTRGLRLSLGLRLASGAGGSSTSSSPRSRVASLIQVQALAPAWAPVPAGDRARCDGLRHAGAHGDAGADARLRHHGLTVPTCAIKMGR